MLFRSASNAGTGTEYLQFSTISTHKNGSMTFYGSSNITDILINTAQNPITKLTFFYWDNINLASPSTRNVFTLSNPFSFTNVKPRNLTNSYTTNNTIYSFSDINGRMLYFDSASITTRDLTTNSNYATLTPYGLHVESGTGLYPDWFSGVSPYIVPITNFGRTYCNDSNIAVAYSNELQLVNGLYTASNTYAYNDYRIYYSPSEYTGYSDYRGVYTTGGMRYATFMWYVNTTISTKLGSITFTIENNNFPYVSGNGTTTGPATFKIYTGGITLQNIIIGLNVPNSTSVWLDANAYLRNINWNNNLGNNAANGLDPSDNNQRQIKATDGGSVGFTPLLFFIRIGLPVQSNFNFKNIRVVI